MLDVKYSVTVFVVCAILSLGHITAAFLLSERRFTLKKTVLIWLSVFVFFSLIVYLSYSFLPRKLRLIFAVAFSFLYFWINFLYTSSDGGWKKCFLWLTYGTVFCFTWPISAHISSAIIPPEYDIETYILRCVIEQMVVFSVLLSYRKHGMRLIKEVGSFDSKAWRRLSIVAFFYFLLSLLLMALERTEEYLPLLFYAIYGLVLITFISVNILSFSNIYYMKKEASASLVRKNVEYLSSYIESAREMERESRRIRHDSRHHNETIRAMAQIGDTNSILKYLGELDENEVTYPQWCPNIMVSSILSSYKKKAEERNIVFTASADTPVSTGIKDIDYVAILCNLLENALNGAEECNSHGPVNAVIRHNDNKYIFVITNPAPQSLTLDNGLPVKRGTGIESVITSIRRYNGEIRYTLENNICRCCVILAP